MSKADRAKKRLQRKAYAQPSRPRVIGANDNHVNDNDEVVVIGGVELTQNQAVNYRNACAKLSSKDISVQRVGHRMMMELEVQIRGRIEARETEDAIETKRRLEELRGFTIGKSKVEGAAGKAQVQRDGLETLRKAASIGTTQHAAGMLYRADYERIDPEKGLTPPALDATRVQAGHGGDNWCRKRREIEERVFAIHLSICGVEPPRDGQRRALPNLPGSHPAMRSIRALVEVAGKGRPLSDLASSGSSRARLRQDLIFGLDACAIFYGLE